MSYDSGKIYKPVSIADVQKAIGVTATDLATLCKSSNINQYSKYKPVIYNSYFPSSSENYWKATDSKSGVVVPQYTSFSDMINAIKASSVKWTYRPPTSIFRLADFNGYNANAQKPIGSISTVQINRGDVITQTVSFIPDQNEDNIGLEEIGLGDFYLSLAIMKSDSDTTAAYLASSPYTVAGTLDAAIPVIIINAYANELNAGTYPMYLFFSKKAMPDLTDQVLVPIDNAIGRLTIINSVTITVSGTYDANDGDYIIYKVVIVNNDSSAKTFSDSYIWLGNDPTGNSVNKKISLGNITVAAGQTKTLTDKVYDSDASPWTVFVANSIIQGYSETE